jgi:hypothetical protein
MNFQDFLSQGLGLIGAFNLKVAAFLFLLCLIGEVAGIFMPYLLETIWLLAGYHFAHGITPLPDLVLLAFVAQLGRQAGVLALYNISRAGSSLLARYRSRFKLKTKLSDTLPFRLLRRINLLSPFGVALGRLLWLRIPLTFVLGDKRKLKVLLLGVTLSSLVYDGTYITLGALVGATTKLEPMRMLLYSLAALTMIYGVTFAIRRSINALIARRQGSGYGVSTE